MNYFMVLVLGVWSFLGMAKQEACPVAREYIATYGYLSDQEDFKLSDEEIEDIAGRVSKGCYGAARRFSTIVDTLVKSRLDTASAIKLGKDLAQRNDGAAETFLMVFRASYASDYLNLDLFQSLNNARSLSFNLDKIPRWLEQDFKDLSAFCVNDMQIPRPKCAEFVTNVLTKAALQRDEDGNPPSVGVAKAFSEGVKFLADLDAGPKLARFEALQMMETLIEISPLALREFKALYRFSMDKEVKPLDRKQALSFAMKVTEGMKQKAAK